MIETMRRPRRAMPVQRAWRILAAAFFLTVAAIGAVWATAAGGPASRGGETGCPPTIAVRQAGIAPAGWEVAYDKRATDLAAVTFFEGPPAEQASLVYDEQTTGTGETRAVWRFTAGGKGTWISCGYDGTRAVLSRRLPAAVHSCTVRYAKTVTSAAGLPAIKGIECR